MFPLYIYTYICYNFIILFIQGYSYHFFESQSLTSNVAKMCFSNCKVPRVLIWFWISWSAVLVDHLIDSSLLPTWNRSQEGTNGEALRREYQTLTRRKKRSQLGNLKLILYLFGLIKWASKCKFNLAINFKRYRTCRSCRRKKTWGWSWKLILGYVAAVTVKNSLHRWHRGQAFAWEHCAGVAVAYRCSLFYSIPSPACQSSEFGHIWSISHSIDATSQAGPSCRNHCKTTHLVCLQRGTNIRVYFQLTERGNPQ